MQHGELRSDRCSNPCQRVRLPVLIKQLQGHLQDRRVTVLHIQGRFLQSPTASSSDNKTRKPVVDEANQTPKTNEKETKTERGNPLCSDIPEWLQEFENLVGDEVPVRGDSHASSSHEASLEPTFKRREDFGKHSVYTHFPKDRNCEICKRTKITRAPCRRRNGEAVFRAEKIGDLTTADHKVFSDNCESRNNHRYAVVVQDLATQWIQSHPCKNKNFTGNPEKLAKVLGAREEA